MWQEFTGLTAYPDAISSMQHTHSQIVDGTTKETIFMLEHPPIYTSGTSAKQSDLINKGNIETIATGRGGQWTYHGPGQRVYWPLLDLSTREKDVRKYVFQLEAWIIQTLACFSIDGQRREGLPGVWVVRKDLNQPNRVDKIAAIGVRISKWVTMHGIAINIDPDLTAFNGIVPCGVTDGGVTSFADLGHIVTMPELDMASQTCFNQVFETE
ncbi:lipoyl(octanoyl) transferase LipB [Alphaproteobacteria bacterium]|nr:lipoyl(octanoyl) transferase LipB [Alphaproteobacteria bacterium]MDC0462220.1 lipoyl(octanoyl) transferase LipB [Alphaproteobacteria bacterium]